MDTREHEKTYNLFIGLTKWSTIIGLIATFIVVVGFIK